MPLGRRAAAPVMRALPLEVTALIVKHSLPAVAFETFSERYSVLRTFLEVNSQWSQIAQRELHRHVKVGRRDSAIAYLERALYGRPDELDDAAKMESLFIGNYGNHAQFPVLQLLLVSPKLTELHLINVESLDAASISVAVGLTSLHIHDSSFVFRDEFLLYLPNLIALSISDVVCVDTKNRGVPPERLLHALSLPQLTYAALHWVPLLQYNEEHSRTHYEENMSPPFLGALAERVRTLVIGRFETPTFRSHLVAELARCTNLEHLTINNPELVEDLLGALIEPLSTLQIGAWYHRASPLDLDDGFVIPYVMNLDGTSLATTAVRDLKSLSLPEVWDWGGGTDDGLLRKHRDQVRRLCADKDVTLVERPLDGEGQDSPVVNWTDTVGWHIS